MSKLKTPKTQPLWVKGIVLVLALVLATGGAMAFLEHRMFKENVVLSPSFTEQRWLSDYEPSLKGTYMDSPVYVFDSGVEGGSMLYLGGTHPYEPATSLSAFVAMNTINVEKGKVFIVPQANFSATTSGVLGNAYPTFYEVETQWGKQKFKIGDRITNPLEQWPDSFTYIHYPSKQAQAYQDIRNLNRCYPGKKDGNPTERLAYAVMELIRQEDISISFDVHEASIMYPVVGTYVAHDRAQDIAMMAAMDLSAGVTQMNEPGDAQFDMKIEVSPKALKGFTHREWGDYSDTLAILMETPEPFIDRIVGPMTEELLVTGRDRFLSYAGDKGLTYVEYSANNNYEWPMDVRVGRHLQGAWHAVYYMNQFFPEKELIFTWPSYKQIVDNGSGYYLSDPQNPKEGETPTTVWYEEIK